MKVKAGAEGGEARGGSRRHGGWEYGLINGIL